LITLHRPKALNALCDGLLDDLIHAARAFDNDANIGAIVITGSPKAFAAGADIKEMSKRTYVETYTKNMFRNWTDITTIVKPTIAAVSGFALGQTVSRFVHATVTMYYRWWLRACHDVRHYYRFRER
jgi:enoyl-CoA hydratase/carnithine racemase